MKKAKYLWYIPMPAFVYFFALKPFIIDEILLMSNNEIAKGKVVNWTASVEGDGDFVFVYVVNDKEYTGLFIDVPSRKVTIGECYPVKYYPSNPKIARIILDRKVACD